MPSFRVFGVSVTVSQAAQAFTLAPGLTLTAAVAASGGSIAIKLDGSWRGLTFSGLSATLPCEVAGGAVTLLKASTSASGTVRVSTGDVAQVDSAPTLVAPEQPQAHGFDIRHRAATLAEVLQDTAGGIPDLDTGFHDGDRWTGSLIRVRIDRATIALVLEDMRPEMRLDDRFGADSILQHLRLQRAQLTPAGFDLYMAPRNHALFLNPDILDGTAAADDRHNALLFQHVLAGVELVGSFTFGGGLWQISGWRIAPAPDAGRWTMAVGAFQDEQGHPLLLQSEADVPLTVRWGLGAPEPGSGLNRALVLGDRDAELSLPITLVSADPAALYGIDRTPARLDARAIPAPYWIARGMPAVQASCPRELHGLARNVALRVPDGAAAAATLVLTPHLDSTRLVAMLPTLEFSNSAGMTLAFDVPEQAVTGAGTLMERRIGAASGKKFSLPLLDVRWAFGDLAGKSSAAHRLATVGAEWIANLDADLTTRAFPQSVMDRYRHTGGHRAAPVAQSFARVLPVAALSTGDPGARIGERMAPVPAVLSAQSMALAAAADDSTPFLFGGPPDRASLDNAAAVLELGRTQMGEVVERFQRFWAGVESVPGGVTQTAWTDARRALRGFLAGEPYPLGDPAGWTLDQLIEASARLEAAREALATGVSAALQLDGLDAELDYAMPDEVAELRDPASAENAVARLFQYAFAPPTMAFLARAVSSVAQTPPVTELEGHLDTLRDVVSAELTAALNDIFRGADAKKKLQGMFAELVQGIAGPYAYLADIWSNPGGALEEIVPALRERYGPALTQEVLEAICANEDDASQLLQALQGLGYVLARLEELSAEPPDYLLVTRRVRRNTSADSERLHPIERAAALWNHRFDFCTFGGGKAWDMFLDDDTTLVVKLGTDRSLDAILTELHRTYQTAQRPDPFALAGDAATGGDPLEEFLALLPAPLREPAWCGILIVNPMVDLERDFVLTSLCGFSHIAARFAAVGGARPARLEDVELDVWGRIENRAMPDGWRGTDGRPVREPEWNEGDVAWTMTRFEASIKNTTVLSGEVGFRLEFRELFGRRLDDKVVVNINGTLPPMPAGQSADDKPRDFKFVGTLEELLDIPIDVAFLEALRLRGVRIGSHDGDTTLDIDADLLCQDWSIGGFTFEAPNGPVALSDVRVRMPRLEGGLSLPMGLQRALGIDFGAIKFPLGPERSLTLAGIVLRPVGVGLLRDTGENIHRALKDAAMELVAPHFNDGPTARYVYPYLDTRVDFGTTPALGGGSQLSLVARVGTPIGAPGDDVGEPGAGLASLDGRNLKLDLFRLLSIEAESVKIRTIDLYHPVTGIKGKRAGTFHVQGFNLKIGSWSLFADSDDRRLIMAHTEDGERGVLAWYAAKPKKTGFFRLQWLLVTRNFDPGKNLKDILISPSNADLDTEIDAVNDIFPDTPDDRLNALVEADSRWMFGVRFELGELFTPCSLLLHDGRYYGIRIGGKVARLLTGEEDLTFAYIPGATPDMDRFRTSFRCAAFDLMATMRSGDMALEWSSNWDFLIDAGQPWRGPNGYMWERAFSMPVGTYEAKFGFFIEKRTSLISPDGVPSTDQRFVTFSAGAGFYLGYFFELNAGIAWVRAGIGIFGVLIGSATLRNDASGGAVALLRGTLVELRVVGVIGIYAYGEGGVEVWVLSARFRVAAQAFVEVTLRYVPNARSVISWNATLSAAYSASVRIGSGWFSWTFSFSGSVKMQINGQAAFG